MRKNQQRYSLYYWPTIQGRGEFVRLALEEAGADYVDVARLPAAKGGGEEAILRILRGKLGPPPFAVPALRVSGTTVSQTANILLFIAPRLGLVPGTDAARTFAHGLQLTLADLVAEVHDTHHPVGVGLTYGRQRPEARRRTRHFLDERLPKFLGYFERLARPRRGGPHLVGGRFSYVDLSIFQLLTGLEYAFPRAFGGVSRRVPRLLELRERVKERPNVAAYLRSARRIPFNEDGIFRHYEELDRA